MTTPENGLSPSHNEQPGFGFEEYIVRNMTSVTGEDVKFGDIVYFNTKSGSVYIFEVETYDSGFLTGQLSRRGEQVVLAENKTLARLESVHAKVYVDFEFLSTGRQSLVTPDQSEGFHTSLVTNLMVVNFNPF